MGYLPTIVITAVGLVLLLVLLLRLVVVLRRFAAVRSLVAAHVNGNVGLVRARSAAARLALAEHGSRRHVTPGLPAPGTIEHQGR